MLFSLILDQLGVSACALTLPGTLFPCLTQMVPQIKRLPMCGKLPGLPEDVRRHPGGSRRIVSLTGVAPGPLQLDNFFCDDLRSALSCPGSSSAL